MNERLRESKNFDIDASMKDEINAICIALDPISHRLLNDIKIAQRRCVLLDAGSSRFRSPSCTVVLVPETGIIAIWASLSDLQCDDEITGFPAV